MRFSAPITALLATTALLVALLAGAGPATAKPLPQGSQATTSKAKHHKRHHRKAKARARRTAAAHGKRGVSDNVSLAVSSAKPRSKAPKPKTSALTPGLLFNGSHLSDFDALEEAPGAMQEVPDPLGSGETVFQVTVNERDVAPITPTENPRAQALSPDIIRPGDEFWLSTKFMIPQNYPHVSSWMSLIGVYGPPYGGPGPWVVEVCNDRLQWMRNRNYNWDVPWSQPLVKGQWTTILMHQRFASDGWIEMWVNGQPISFFGRETRLSMQTADGSNSGGANSARISQYREAGQFETGTLYFGALKLGLTRESVGG
jgi:hypothetical protein